MHQKHVFLILLASFLAAGLFWVSMPPAVQEDYVSYEVNLKSQDFRMYWKDDQGQLFRSIGNLKSWLAHQGYKLRFAMNAGMYRPDYTPQGLFIQNYKIMVPLDTSSGQGNFYLKPNGVFYTTTENQALIGRTEDFKSNSNIKYATQSGPMLLINGQIHAAFKAGSTNLNIRNGVGILANGNIIFAMSKEEVNLYDFARYFKNKGCRSALYLDGFVSRSYLPEKQWVQTDGDFGVLIAVIEKK